MSMDPLRNGAEQKLAVLIDRVDSLRGDIAELKAWTASHERDEFGFHGRIEAFMGAALSARDEVSRRLRDIEVQQDGLGRKVWLIVGAWGLAVPSAFFLLRHFLG